MLKDNILSSMLLDNENSAKPLDTFTFPVEGYLKIVQKDMDTGEIIHVDEDHNKVLQWARHSTFHCLTGSPFSDQGETRLKNPQEGEPYHSDSVNEDGTVISGEQFFTGTDLRYWTESTIGGGSYIYSYYPTKLLLGTSAEFTSWDDIKMTSAYKYQAQNDGYTMEIFNKHLVPDQEVQENITNDYSNRIDESGQLLECRSMNDISAAKTNDDISLDSFGISGAIKTTITNETELNARTEEDNDDDRFLVETPEWKGIGRPCFIYSIRDNTPETDSDILIGRTSSTNNFDNRLSFSFLLPEQNESSAMNKFYPYNGYLLKEAGLFCDSKLLTYNSLTSRFEPDTKMPYGIIFAKRYISPFTKTGSTSVSVNWVLYY